MTVYNTGGAIGCMQLETDIRKQPIEYDGRKYVIDKDSFWKFFKDNERLVCCGAPTKFSITESRRYKGLIDRFEQVKDVLVARNTVACFNFDVEEATRFCGFGRSGIGTVLYRSINPNSREEYRDQSLREELTGAIWNMIEKERREIYGYLAGKQLEWQVLKFLPKQKIAE